MSVKQYPPVESIRQSHPTYSRVPSQWKHVAKEWTSWRCAKERCYLKATPSYAYVGGRGLGMCDRWRHSFAAFMEDMGKAPSNRHTIDRKDNDKGYEPGNCRWATRLEQQSNTRVAMRIEIDGQTHCLREWCRRSNMNLATVACRIRRGWPIKTAIQLRPIRKYDSRFIKKVDKSCPVVSNTSLPSVSSVNSTTA